MGNSRKWTTLQSKAMARRSKVNVWAKAETTKDTFEQPASTDILKVNEPIGVAQLAERVEEAGLDSGSRSPQGTFLGKFDHMELPIVLHPRPPAALGGSSVPQEDVPWTGVMGSRKITNSQAAEDITSVVSHARGSTVIQIADDLADWSTMPHGIRYISNNSDTADNDGLYLVTAASEPSSGTVQLTIEPGLPHFPEVNGTADQIQGVTVYYADDSENWEDTGYSLLVEAGFQAFGIAGGHWNDVQITRDARNMMVATFGYHGKSIAWRASEDQVVGDGSVDSFTTTDLTLGVGNASKFTAGALVKLVLVDVATDAIMQTEGATTPAKIDSVNTSNNTITFASGNRGDTPVSADNLTAETTATEESAETYDTVTYQYLKIALDGRTAITIDLQSPTAPSTPAAATAAELVANINYAFKTSKHYGQHISGRGGRTIDYSSVAVETAGNAVHIVSPLWGSESKIQVYDTGLATSAHADVFSGTFTKTPDDEVQILPWTPGGSVTLDGVHMKRGMPSIDGHYIQGSSFEFSFSNETDWIEDTITLDFYPQGALPGERRTLGASFTTPGYGWTDELETLAEADATHFFRYPIGDSSTVGRAYAIFMPAAKLGTVEPGGDNRLDKTVQISPENTSTTGIKEAIVLVG